MHDIKPVPLDKREKIERWIQEARNGCPQALGHLLECCRSYMLHLANQAVSSPLRIKVAPSDLVQETSLDAHRGFAQFQGECLEELLGWLRSILLHHAANANRRYETASKRQMSREIPLEIHQQLAGELKDRTLSPSALMAAGEKEDQLEWAIGRLPDDLRTALLLRSRDHFSYAEIGLRMQRSSEAARKLWVRAVERLQQELFSADERT